MVYYVCFLVSTYLSVLLRNLFSLGGYSYRLCKRPEEGVVTEECFQASPLTFHGDSQWVQYGEGGEKISFLANRTTEGTWPEGSQWTKNPIPACLNPDGGWMETAPGCPTSGTQV